MAALSADRSTPELLSPRERVLPVAASVKIYAGSIVCINAAGYATKGATATGLVAVGRAEEAVDNSTGAAGDKSVRAKRGIFRFTNSAGGDAIGRAEIGSTCYVVDDQTVAKTSAANTRSPAGKVYDVDGQGVWVELG